jgi:hypothetical protein
MNVLYTSYGKDSHACFGACEHLGIKIDRAVHFDVWATDTISADLPPMVEFKKHADKIIKERYGIEVEHYRADNSYERQFYTKKFHKETQKDVLYGFPIVKGAWCNSRLKMEARKKLQLNSDDIEILGIAADEPKRIERHQKRDDVILPLVEIGWTEAMCREWCEKNDLLSPIYTTATRGGCWFCHNQGVDQLRLLRKNYPDLWALLLKWDNDSPVTFKPDGHTVHDFDKRFEAEEKGIVPADRKFRWNMIER